MAIPFLNHIDLTKSEIRRVSLHQTTTASVGNEKFTGQIIFDTGDSKAKYYDGSAWITMGDTDNYVDGMSLSGNTLTLTRTGSLSDLTQDLSSIVPSDVVDGTGAAGQVAYWSDSDTITGENDFSWDATNNRLGVGVGLSPTANLDIKRSVTSIANSLALTDSRASVKIIGSTTGDSQLTFSHGSGGLEQIQASNSAADTVKALSLNPYGGDVYINVNDTGAGSTALLILGTTTTQTSQINMSSNTGTNDGSIINASHKLTLRIASSATEQIVLDDSGHVHFKTYGSGNVTGTEAKNLSVTSAGKIIETTPVTNTDVLQGVSAGSTNAERYVTFVDNATGAQQAKSDANFRFNPSTDTLSVTNLVVSGTQTISDETVQVVENNTILFEGATDDAYETKLTVIDPTADRTISLPNNSGTVALVGDLPTVNDATLTVQGTGVLGGTGTFTANDADTTTISITHDAVSRTNNTSTASPGYGATFTAIDSITTSTEGHVTAVNTKTITIPASDNTDTNTQLATKQALIDVSAMGTNTVATINHGLGSDYLIVQLYDEVTGQVVYADVEYTSDGSTISDDHVRVQFSSTPTNDIRVVIIDASTGISAGSVSYS